MKNLVKRIIHKIGKIFLMPFLQPEFTRITERLEKIDFELHPTIFMSSEINGNKSFSDIFRGDEKMIKNRHKVYVSLLSKCKKVADLGCGRGELLELLSERKIGCIGVDNDVDMVKVCKSKGLNVLKKDASSFLHSSVSIDAVCALQFIEHLTVDQLNVFLELCYKKLPQKGILLLETVNPHCFPALKMFYTDPSHTKPVFPEVLEYLLKKQGFREVNIRLLHSVFDSSKKSLPLKSNGNIFEFADYSAYAVK